MTSPQTPTAPRRHTAWYVLLGMTVLAVSVLGASAPGIFLGMTRFLFTPASQWSTDNATTLMLINKRAIPPVGSLTG